MALYSALRRTEGWRALPVDSGGRVRHCAAATLYQQRHTPTRQSCSTPAATLFYNPLAARPSQHANKKLHCAAQYDAVADTELNAFFPAEDIQRVKTECRLHKGRHTKELRRPRLASSRDGFAVLGQCRHPRLCSCRVRRASMHDEPTPVASSNRVDASCFFCRNCVIQIGDECVGVIDMTREAEVDQQVLHVVLLGTFEFDLAAVPLRQRSSRRSLDTDLVLQQPYLVLPPAAGGFDPGEPLLMGPDVQLAIGSTQNSVLFSATSAPGNLRCRQVSEGIKARAYRP